MRPSTASSGQHRRALSGAQEPPDLLPQRERGWKRDQDLPNRPLTPSLSESCLIGATGHSSMLPLVFPESHTKDSRGPSSKGQPAGRDPPAAADPEESQSLWHLCLCLRGQDRTATQPSPAPGTTDASGQKGSSSSPSNEGFFLSKQQLLPGRGRGFIYSHSFSWVFWNCRFPPGLSSGAGCTIEPAIFRSLTPHAASEEATALPEFLLAPFIKPPTSRILSGKGSWSRNARSGFGTRSCPGMKRPAGPERG